MCYVHSTPLHKKITLKSDLIEIDQPIFFKIKKYILQPLWLSQMKWVIQKYSKNRLMLEIILFIFTSISSKFGRIMFSLQFYIMIILRF